jgi:uncharacterized protein (TIGR00369 family)
VSTEELFARIGRSPYHVENGIELVEASPGRAVMRMRIAEAHMNPQGIVHGGAIAGLLDSVCGLSLRTQLEGGVQHRTVQLNVNFLRAAQAGVLTATGTAVHDGRRTSMSEAEVRDEAGKLVARATATFVKLDV